MKLFGYSWAYKKDWLITQFQLASDYYWPAVVRASPVNKSYPSISSSSAKAILKKRPSSMATIRLYSSCENPQYLPFLSAASGVTDHIMCSLPLPFSRVMTRDKSELTLPWLWSSASCESSSCNNRVASASRPQRHTWIVCLSLLVREIKLADTLKVRWQI